MRRKTLWYKTEQHIFKTSERNFQKCPIRNGMSYQGVDCSEIIIMLRSICTGFSVVCIIINIKENNVLPTTG